MSRRLKIGLLIAVLAACVIFALGAILLPRIFGAIGEWYNDEYFEVTQVLFDYMGTTGIINNGEVQMGFITGGDSGQTEVRMLVNVETIEHCTGTAIDPCEALADDMARLVLQRYSSVDEIDGLDITISTVDESGVANPSIVYLRSGSPSSSGRLNLAQPTREVSLGS